MATFNLTTSGTSGINLEHVGLFLQSSQNAEVVGQDHGPSHIAGHNWSFPNLIPSTPYVYKWGQIIGGVLDVYRSQNFTVPAAGSIETKTDLYITADITPNVFSGLTEFTLDGTNGSPDIRGWGIRLEHKGYGTQFPVVTVEYDYDIVTGKISVKDSDAVPYEIQPGDKYIIIFQPKVNTSAPVVVQGLFTGTKYVNTDTSILPADFGKNLIRVDGTTTYLQLLLPDIFTAPENRILPIISGGGNHKCFAITSQNANAIDWLYGNMTSIYCGVYENISIYRQNNTWQVFTSFGNYFSVGMRVQEHTPLANTLNKVPANGSLCSLTTHARLYQYVLKLPPGEVTTFALWPTDQRKFSLADTAGNFHVPNWDNLFARQGNTPGIFRDHQMLNHKHEESIGTLENSYGWGQGPVDKLVGKYGGTGSGKPDLSGPPVVFNGTLWVTSPNMGTETYPMHATERWYYLC